MIDLSTARPGTRLKARNGTFARVLATDIRGIRSIAVAYEDGADERVDAVCRDGRWWASVRTGDHKLDIVAIVP